jgi:TPR repeat protein
MLRHLARLSRFLSWLLLAAMTQPVPAQELPPAPRSSFPSLRVFSRPQLVEAYTHWLEGRFAEVVALVRPLAQQEDPAAQYLLGKLYSSGEGVPLNEELAIEWWRKAAEQGLGPAQNELGVALADGWGVERDPQQAVAWLRKAAEQGMTTAQVNLGLMYLNGVGVRRSETEAVKLFRQAAEQGMGWAQYYLGIAYAEGRGVTPNRALAVQWTRRAAEQDYTQAQVSMGVFYMQGQAVRRDEGRAIYWFARAAQDGDEPASRQLERLLPRLRNVQLPIGTNVLSAPEASSAIVVTAEADEPAYVLETREDWVEVYLERGHSLGFVSRQDVPGQQGRR